MQFKLIAAALASLAATSVMANPLPNAEAAEGAQIMARAEQAEQAKQGKQIFGGPGLNGLNNWNNPGFQQPGLQAFGFGGGGVNLQGNPFGNQNNNCPGFIQCFQCNGFAGWGGQGQCGFPLQGCPCF